MISSLCVYSLLINPNDFVFGPEHAFWGKLTRLLKHFCFLKIVLKIILFYNLQFPKFTLTCSTKNVHFTFFYNQLNTEEESGEFEIIQNQFFR